MLPLLCSYYYHQPPALGASYHSLRLLAVPPISAAAACCVPYRAWCVFVVACLWSSLGRHPTDVSNLRIFLPAGHTATYGCRAFSPTPSPFPCLLCRVLHTCYRSIRCVATPPRGHSTFTFRATLSCIYYLSGSANALNTLVAL